MENALALQLASPLGFRTDRDDPKDKIEGYPERGYPVEIVRDCFIEATMRGAVSVGNEWNIITRDLPLPELFPVVCMRVFRTSRTFACRREFRFRAAKPCCLVPYSAYWKWQGVPGEMHCQVFKGEGDVTIDERIPVRVNAGMGADAILGKAERKDAREDLGFAHGFEQTDGDISEVVEGQPKAQLPVGRHLAQGKATGNCGTRRNGSRDQWQARERWPRRRQGRAGRRAGPRCCSDRIAKCDSQQALKAIAEEAESKGPVPGTDLYKTIAERIDARFECA